MELCRKEDDHEHTKVKRRDTHAKVGKAADEVVDPSILFVPGNQPQWDGQCQRQQQGASHQQDGGWQTLHQHRCHRCFIGKRNTKVTTNCFRRPGKILLRHTAVQTEFCDYFGFFFLCHLRRKVHGGNVTRRQIDNGKGKKGNQHHNDGQLTQFAQTKFQHLFFSFLVFAKRLPKI